MYRSELNPTSVVLVGRIQFLVMIYYLIDQYIFRSYRG
jgi:hypothetical protein